MPVVPAVWYCTCCEFWLAWLWLDRVLGEGEDRFSRWFDTSSRALLRLPPPDDMPSPGVTVPASITGLKLWDHWGDMHFLISIIGFSRFRYKLSHYKLHVYDFSSVDVRFCKSPQCFHAETAEAAGKNTNTNIMITFTNTTSQNGNVYLRNSQQSWKMYRKNFPRIFETFMSNHAVRIVE